MATWQQNMIITVTEDGLEPCGARTSTGNVITTLVVIALILQISAITSMFLLINGHPRQTPSISRTNYQHLNVSHFVLQSNPMQPGVKSKMKMPLEQRRQAMIQLHLSDQQVNSPLRRIMLEVWQYSNCPTIYIVDFRHADSYCPTWFHMDIHRTGISVVNYWKLKLKVNINW